ncbi:MAG: global cell cycle regulator GcrA-like protein [Alphaproteobacteria bacterium]|nr:GcrA family cell cycle regulator [Alphaproteobacteria bacterium]TAD88402.1 MAG: global cell cycle regulator GcrA-like protein [Alphaproteobacteria bacterium]
MEWTPEKVDELTRLWDSGIPTAEIGRLMGCTKNTVIGKVHRLGLTPRKVMAPKPQAPRLLELKGPVCCWPIGHPGTPEFRFCGAPAAPGKPYCAEHVAVAYIKQRPQRERAA